MISDAEIVRLRCAPLMDWLDHGGDVSEADRRYWEVRRDLMDRGSEVKGPAARILGSLDTTMDVFNPSGDRGDWQIDETEMRAELVKAIEALRNLGFL